MHAKQKNIFAYKPLSKYGLAFQRVIITTKKAVRDELNVWTRCCYDTVQYSRTLFTLVSEGLVSGKTACMPEL